jgi:hypothetical protein
MARDVVTNLNRIAAQAKAALDRGTAGRRRSERVDNGIVVLPGSPAAGDGERRLRVHWRGGLRVARNALSAPGRVSIQAGYATGAARAVQSS